MLVFVLFLLIYRKFFLFPSRSFQKETVNQLSELPYANSGTFLFH